MYFKFIRSCLLAAPSPHQVLQPDVFLLHRFLHPVRDADINLPLALWDHLINVASLDAGIHVGGHITRILDFMELMDDPTEMSQEFYKSGMISPMHLAYNNYLRLNPLRWRVARNMPDEISLPCASLPSLETGMPHYLLRGEFPRSTTRSTPLASGFATRKRLTRTPHTAPSSSSYEEPSTHEGPSTIPPQSEPLSSQDQCLTDIRTDVAFIRTQMTGMCEDMATMRRTLGTLDGRVSDLERNFNAVSYPAYNWMYRTGMVPRGLTPPSFFIPPEERWNVDLSQGFDNLSLGGFRFTSSPRTEPSSSSSPTFGEFLDLQNRPAPGGPTDQGMREEFFTGLDMDLARIYGIGNLSTQGASGGNLQFRGDGDQT